MTAYTPAVISRAGGLDLTTGLVAVASTGDTFPAGYQNMLRVKNGGGTVCNVTLGFTAGAGPAGTTITDFALGSVAITTGDRLFGPFPASPFADANGNINPKYSSITTVTAGCYQLSTS